jgi:hypothetical protein
MKNLFILIAATIAVGLLYKIYPAMRYVYGRFRHKKVVMCPDTESLADVELNACWAAFTAFFRKPVVRVKSCSLWAGKKGCVQGCVKDNWTTE